jgi:UDP-N-acetylmuramyl pentapeptide phosphotransferase/UDP-N-acetylglucosamine-1-phosphate transferase
MRSLVVIGIALVLLGVLSFFVPVPTSTTHEFKAGDTSLDVTTHHRETLPPVAGGILCVAGVVVLVLAGTRKAA